jgi:hypothetical protein
MLLMTFKSSPANAEETTKRVAFAIKINVNRNRGTFITFPFPWAGTVFFRSLCKTIYTSDNVSEGNLHALEERTHHSTVYTVGPSRSIDFSCRVCLRCMIFVIRSGARQLFPFYLAHFSNRYNHGASISDNTLFGVPDFNGAINEEGTSSAPRIHQRMLSHP